MNSIKKLGLLVVILAVAIIGYNYITNSPSKTNTAYQASGEVLQPWLTLVLDLTEETPGFSPPVAARAFGYTGVSVYESVRFGIPNAKSLAGQVNGFSEDLLSSIDSSKEYKWELVANANVAAMVRELYPNVSAENAARIDETENALEATYSEGVPEQVIEDSIALGRAVAEKMAEYAASDGQSEGYKMNFPKEFVPPVGEGYWVPTPGTYMSALQPYWGETRPFLTEDIAGTLPPAPPEYSLDEDSQFFIEVKEVYDTVENLTEEQETIARFWSDDPGSTPTPPGHSISILAQVLAQEDSSLAEASQAFAKVGMAVHDAFIACWYAKFQYNLIRPITVILEHIDPEFTIPLNTPPFPEYPSGHSVQSGAAAQALTDLFGENYTFSDATHAERTDIDGSPRTFNSFNEFAEEAAISRLYGGIHFRTAIELGVAQGREIGKNIGKLTLIK